MKGKALKKTAADIRRNVSREHGFRQSAYINFKVDGGYFFCLYFFANGSAFPNEAKLTVKPMYADTLWWEIWDSPDCIDAPISLRGTGAYALSGMVLAKYENLIDPKESGDSEMKDLYEHIFSQADTEISRFISENPDADTFYPDETKMDYDPDRLLYLMALIHNGRDEEALSIIKEARSNKHHCVFRSGWNSDSYTYIKRWCNRTNRFQECFFRINHLVSRIFRLYSFLIMSMTRDRHGGLPNHNSYSPLQGGILAASVLTFIVSRSYIGALIMLLLLSVLFWSFFNNGKTRHYYSEFLKLPQKIQRKWTIASWTVTTILWIYIVILITCISIL
ncbi:hypothetical protein [Phocaeicola sartorii]|uniref:hypothetical protein n=1 Tax=Phocaeicola sartorii TaxID=671267 RepID=UPI002558133D|nr:hypothetical protein [Phocaeicola sartorii]